MAASPEHKFISSSLDKQLESFSATGFLGVQEAERRKFDYACRIHRDCLRSLVAQVFEGGVGVYHRNLQVTEQDGLGYKRS
jgi:hypothetical protein